MRDGAARSLRQRHSGGLIQSVGKNVGGTTNIVDFGKQ